MKRIKKMKTIAQQLNIKSFPFEIEDSDGNGIYYEKSDGYWFRHEYDSNGNVIYYENSEIETIIELCDDIDGEALQYIIRSVGMEYQMLRQLVMMAPTYLLEDLIEEKMNLEDAAIHLNDDEAKEWEDFWWKEEDGVAIIPEDFFVD